MSDEETDMTTQSRSVSATSSADRYARLTRMPASDHCVILDGANGTELIKVREGPPEVEEQVWKLTALLDAPQDVAHVHRSYIDVGCDVICTNTWGRPTALREPAVRLSYAAEPVHWMDIARRAVSLARQAAADAGREDEVAVAFSLHGDADTPDGRETIHILSRGFEEEPPDLILLETLSLVRTSTYATVEPLLDTGIPVWLSFRRCRSGAGGVYGGHWGGPEGDSFGRPARRFEEMGVGALAINCIPPDTSAACCRGCATSREGAQIMGGCCGVRPEHLSAARTMLADTKPGHDRPNVLSHEDNGLACRRRRLPTWADPRGRQMFPPPCRRSRSTTASSSPRGQLFWHGSICTGRASALSAAAQDRYPWVLEERYDVIVTSLYQTPVDPFEQVTTTHRPLDYWGRNLLDHLIRLLPEALADDGTAYVMQLSTIGRRRTVELLDRLGYQARVVDLSFFEFSNPFQRQT